LISEKILSEYSFVVLFGTFDTPSELIEELPPSSDGLGRACLGLSWLLTVGGSIGTFSEFDGWGIVDGIEWRGA
jgi:hypothetical protein